MEVTYLISDGRTLRAVRRAHDRGGRSSRFGPAVTLTQGECTPVELQVVPGRFRLGCREPMAPAALAACAAPGAGR